MDPSFDLRTAWALFKSHWRAFVEAELAIVAAWVVLETAVIFVHRLELPSIVGWGIWLALHLGFLCIFAGLWTGIHAMALKAVDGGKPTGGEILNRISSAGASLLALTAYCLSVAAGLCLLIVPGVLAAVRWSLFGQVLAAERSSAPGALRTAASLSVGRFRPLFGLVLLSFALNVAGAALLGIGFFVSFPVTVLLKALFYRALSVKT